MYAYMGTFMIFTIDIRLRKNAMFWVQKCYQQYQNNHYCTCSKFLKDPPASLNKDCFNIYTGIYGIKSRTLMKNKGERILATTFQ